jgi:thiamine-monophosphate kinase
MEGLLDGLTDAAGRLECPLSGGDLSAIDGPVVIDVSVAGTCPSGTAMRRDAGKKDDLLIVTGALGNAAAGLRHLQDPAHPHRARWHDSWTRPAPRIKEGVLLRERGVVCAGDISDGLLADCARTARASGCGAEIWIDQLPVDPEIQTAFPDWLAIATGSGEDFELLAAVAPDKIDAVMRNWPDDLAPLRIVGRLTGGSDVSILPTKGGDPVTLPAIISGHFDG